MSDQRPDEANRWDETVTRYVSVGEAITTAYSRDALEGLELTGETRLLDVAAGTGALSLMAARRGASVVATDLSPGMISFLRERARAVGLAGLDARVMDGQKLDLPDSSFDVACSAFGVFLFPDHRAGLAEMRRVIVPGGSVRLMVWSRPERLAHLKIWEDALQDAYPGFDDYARPAGWMAMNTPEGLAAELERAGFDRVTTRTVRHEWPIPSAAWLLAQQMDLYPQFERHYERLGPGSRERVRRRLLDRLEAEHGDGPFSLPAEALLGIGYR